MGHTASICLPDKFKNDSCTCSHYSQIHSGHHLLLGGAFLSPRWCPEHVAMGLKKISRVVLKRWSHDGGLHPTQNSIKPPDPKSRYIKHGQNGKFSFNHFKYTSWSPSSCIVEHPGYLLLYFLKCQAAGLS